MSDKSKKKDFPPPSSSSSFLLQSLPSSKPSSSQFLPGSVIDRFLALHSLGRGTSASPAQSSTSSPNSTGCISTKRQKLSPAIPMKHSTHTCTTLRQPLSSFKNQCTTASGPKPKVQTGTKDCPRTQSSACATTLDHRDNNDTLARTVFSTEPGRSYDRLQPPGLETHRYIASSRILQNRALVNALIDPECGRVQLVERDFEYLRVLLPTGTSNHTTTRVEADLILDEDTAIVLYPLRELGQATIQDSNAGLNELLAILARIGPRFKTVWLMLEEYTWSSTAAASRQRRNSTAAEGCSSVSRVGSFSGTTPTLVPRINTFAGPVTAQLNKLMAWIPLTHDRQHWRSRMTNRIKSQQSFHHPGSVHDQLLSVFKGTDAFKFKTRVLYAFDERCTARIVRAIGEGIVTRINRAVAAGVRRDEDGWCNGEEWLWRDWLSDVDSTHERLLGLFQLFNPFSIQLILSLCSIKEFLAMDQQQRVRTVGKFIDAEILHPSTFSSTVDTLDIYRHSHDENIAIADKRQSYNMVRYEKDEGNINIAWGYDEPLNGYFLTVADTRLSWREGASEDVNKVCEKVCMEGDGVYFNINTYPVCGYGRKVSEATIFTFMRRFGIKPTEIDVYQSKTRINVDQSKPKINVDQNKPKINVNQSKPKINVDQNKPKINVDQSKPKINVDQNKPKIDVDQNKPKINVDQSKTEMHVLHRGGETPESRIGSSSVMQRRAKFQKLFVESVDNPIVVAVARIDRTITELCKQYDVPIMRKGLVPPTAVARTTIFFAQDAYSTDFKECNHPDCRLPEINDDKHKRCARCKKVWYCSRTCQKADWKEHKVDCQESE